MKLALDIGYSGARVDIPMEKILLAERLGFDSVWSAEAYGSDAFSPLAYIAALTKRIRLGTGIAQLAGRTPTMAAMTAQTIDALAGEGRMIVGLGVSNPQVVEGWYGQPWGKPGERLRDYVAIMRKVWAREAPLTHSGTQLSVPYAGADATGLGKPLKSILHGNPHIPIYLGTSTPANLRLTGEIADGLVTMHVTPGTLPRKLAPLREGIARRTDGKTLADFEIVSNLRIVITDDVRGAMAASRAFTALYVGGMGAKEQNFHKAAMIERGYGEAAERIQELYLAGHKQEAEAAVPDEYLDEAALYGPRERIKERFPIWADAGFTILRLTNMDDEALKLAADLFAG
ncbi:LLM class F420-dependent oxidoreductase [Novosphingobium bradum]|uniref:LLM class F420-dependent oxidoreductase n=1 Tax=Novosphingobium bradum TaxID=1737444 RepID=A0ABV7IPI8_9SPHN